MARPTPDEAVERLLKRSLGAHSAAGDEVCPDPDLLAAYTDGGLSRSDALQVERHASSCAMCTQILALVVQAEPAPSIASPGGILAAWRMWRWAIPVATLTTVAGLWFVSTRPPVVRDNTAPNVGVQVAEPAREVAQEEPKIAAAPPQTYAPERVQQSQSNQQKERERSERELAKSDVSIQAEPALAEKREADALSRDAADRRQSPAAAAETSALSARADAVAAPPPPAAAGAASERAAPAAPSAAAPQAVQSRLRAAVPSPLVRGRDGILWQALGTAIQQSSNGGVTWTQEYLANRSITGGVAAASGDVVWFFGRAGLLLRRTTAGWSPVQVPADVDIVSMEAPNANTATITLSDGRRFQTNNGGANWTPR